jgi:hypothetical protein
MKKPDKVLIIFLLLGGIFFIGKTVYNKVYEKNFIIKELQHTNEKHISMIDSLIITNTLLEEYYCATENLLDSIFKHYVWQDVMDPYKYYESVDNIYYNEYLYKYLEDKRKNYE